MSQKSKIPFVHLHNHTHYSLLDGLTKVPQLIDRVKELGMPAVAITDHGTMSGVIEFYETAKAQGIKPIIGIESYVAMRKHDDRDPHKDKNNHHIILLAMNNEGYQNLIQLSTIANLDGVYYKPRIDKDLLKKYQKGLICLSACIGGEVGSALRNDNYEQAKKVAKEYKEIFGDRYYLELQDHGHFWPEQKKVNDQLLKLGSELDIECVLTSDAHYLDHADQEAHEILLCVQTGSFYSDEKRMSLKDFNLSVADPHDIAKRWSDNPELLSNTVKIAERCDVDIKLGDILIPKFKVEEGETEASQLVKNTYSGLVERYTDKSHKQAFAMSIEDAKKVLSQEVVERADYELSIINKMGFDGYFLITADLINWGKERGIVFGPGRGSAAGSIVSYGLNITDLDPLEYQLIFERFLNPDRISMPDIDIDIQDSRRDEVIEYVVEKYGQDNVAHIITFGTMAARNAIRDVARVLEFPYAESDRIAKLVPPPIQGRHIPLADSLQKDVDLKNEYKNNKAAQPIFDQAVKLEGTIRSHGVHAAGVVIAPDKITKYTPLERSQKGVITTQYAMGPVERIGLLKMDFLGLSNLTIVKNALRIINKVYDQELNINDIKLDDEVTFKLLCEGRTVGTFQLESDGMRRYIQALKPEKLDDIIAMVALYRPGPLTAGYVDKFVARKNGDEATTYDNSFMEDALGATYGVLVYQEQVMTIARNMAGFSGSEADNLRKAVAKKKRDVMEKIKQDFINGSIKHGKVTKDYVEKFWSELEGFADYAFPKAHAACYALISYWTAYLKANYFDAYMAALMTSNFGDTDRLARYIDECRSNKVEVTLPDVNQSFAEFAVIARENKIRFGLSAIKNVGTGAAESLVASREEHGEWKTLEEFLATVDQSVTNKKTLESLIMAGALDTFGDRLQLIDNLETIVKFAHNIHKQQSSNQADLFGDQAATENAKLELRPVTTKFEAQQALNWERELMGVYISDNPLRPFSNYFREHGAAVSQIKKIKTEIEVSLGCQISTKKEIVTKRGQKMCFLTVEDEKGDSIEVVIFPDTYIEFSTLCEPGGVVLLTGKTSQRSAQDDTSIVADDFRLITQDMAAQYKPKGKDYELKGVVATDSRAKVPKLYINIVDPYDSKLLNEVKSVLSQYQGEDTVVLVLGVDDDKTALRLPIKIALDNQKLVEGLKKLVGDGAVIIR